MRDIIEQYGRVFLITVIMILILLLLPQLAKQVDEWGGGTQKKASENVTGEISFTIDGTLYYAEKDMSWEDWVASPYNTGGKYRVIYLCGEKYLVEDTGGIYDNLLP